MIEKPDTIVLTTRKPRGANLRFIAFSSAELRKLRKEFKINQSELADNIGVNRSLISHWEKEDSGESPNHERLCQLGRYFSSLAGHKIVFYAEWENKDSPNYWGRQ